MNRMVLSIGAVIVVIAGGASVLVVREASRDAVVSFDASECPGTWWSSVSELQGGAGSATSELEAILTEVDSMPFSSKLPEDARRIVTTPDENGFVLANRETGSASFTLVMDGVALGSLTIERFGEHSFGASGATWCVDRGATARP
jgi:hypothetical protein